MVTEEDIDEDVWIPPQQRHCEHCNETTTHVDTGGSVFFMTCVICHEKN